MISPEPLILITGKSGQVGYELVRIMTLLGNVIAVDLDDLDMSKPDNIIKFMREHKPSIVINTAGYTAVDTAEKDPETAMQINGIAPGIIAEELKRTDGLMVHFSTDYAYDGEKNAPYHENDPLNPMSVYARTKVAGDTAIVASGVKHLIIRTSWIYGARGKNFLLTMLSMCKQRTEMKVVNDQLGAPTWCRSLAEGVGLILSQKEAFDPAYSGFYNMTCGGKVTWYEFAVNISKYFEFNIGRRVTIFPISTGEYPMKAGRPKYSVLNNQKLNNTFKVMMPDWETSFKLVMQDMGYKEPASYSIYPRTFAKRP